MQKQIKREPRPKRHGQTGKKFFTHKISKAHKEATKRYRKQMHHSEG